MGREMRGQGVGGRDGSGGCEWGLRVVTEWGRWGEGRSHEQAPGLTAGHGARPRHMPPAGCRDPPHTHTHIVHLLLTMAEPSLIPVLARVARVSASFMRRCRPHYIPVTSIARVVPPPMGATMYTRVTSVCTSGLSGPCDVVVRARALPCERCGHCADCCRRAARTCRAVTLPDADDTAHTDHSGRSQETQTGHTGTR